MELTGKCREEFDKWFTDSDNHKGLDAEQIALDRKYRLNLFYQLYPSMRYGVLVDYFDSVGIDIVDNIDSCANDFRYLSKVDFKYIDAHNTRSEARTAAIEKAYELRNEVLNK